MADITGNVAQRIIAKNKPEAKPKKEQSKPKQTSKKKEIRDKRVQIVLTQSLYDELVETRWRNKTKSLNEAIIQAITEYIERSK